MFKNIVKLMSILYHLPCMPGCQRPTWNTTFLDTALSRFVHWDTFCGMQTFDTCPATLSVILQSISQLEGLYGHTKAMTIINNCDNCLYLGGQDVDTANYISTKINLTPTSVLNLPLDKAYLFTRGSEPKSVEKYDIKNHNMYRQLNGKFEINKAKRKSAGASL